MLPGAALPLPRGPVPAPTGAAGTGPTAPAHAADPEDAADPAGATDPDQADDAEVPEDARRRRLLLAAAGLLAVLLTAAAAWWATSDGPGPGTAASPTGWAAAYTWTGADGTRDVQVQSADGAVRLEVSDASGTAVVVREGDGTGWTCALPPAGPAAGATCWDAGDPAAPLPPALLDRVVVDADGRTGQAADADGCVEDAGGRWCHDASGRLQEASAVGARLERTSVGGLDVLDAQRPRAPQG